MLLRQSFRCALLPAQRPQRVAVVPRATDKQAESVTQAIHAVEEELNALMKEVESGVLSDSFPALSSYDATQFCDENGCVILAAPEGESRSGAVDEILKRAPGLGRAAPLDKMLSGTGWRIGLKTDSMDVEYCAMALQMFKSSLNEKSAGVPTLKEFDLTFQVGVTGLRSVMATWEASVVNDLIRTLEAQLEGFAVKSSMPSC
eukprot:gene30709-35737_t